MMRMRTKNDMVPPEFAGASGGSGTEKQWELRPGGMLVQKRTDGEETRAPPPTIRVRVKYGSIYHEIRINCQATFGELKKMLSGPTGLHHQDQKLLYKDKERDSNAFLDSAGVKDKSKIVLEEDPISKEKRYLEMRKNAKMEKVAKTLSDISLEVERLGGQVSALETVISKGGKVVEKDVVNLIELLMNQLLKLDSITADGDIKLQRKMQVRRIQKYVETLDMIKLKNSTPSGKGNSVRHSNGSGSSPVQQQQQARHSFGNSVITTQWETFDSAPTPVLGTPPSTSSTIHQPQPSFTWDLL
ncbi:hypothetical protein ACS0TY_010386 [Phlomoides rotata]